LAAFQDLAIRAGELSRTRTGAFSCATCGANAPKSGRRSDSSKWCWSRGRRRWDPRKRFARATLLAGGRPGVLTRIQTSRPVPHPPGCRCTWSAFRAASAMPDSPELCSGLPSDRLPARLGDPHQVTLIRRRPADPEGTGRVENSRCRLCSVSDEIPGSASSNCSGPDRDPA
jgi:hypothetical protein